MRLEIRPLILLDFVAWLLELKNNSLLKEEGVINNIVDVVIVKQHCIMPTSKRWFFLKIIQVTMTHAPFDAM